MDQEAPLMENQWCSESSKGFWKSGLFLEGLPKRQGGSDHVVNRGDSVILRIIAGGFGTQRKPEMKIKKSSPMDYPASIPDSGFPFF